MLFSVCSEQKQSTEFMMCVSSRLFQHRNLPRFESEILVLFLISFLFQWLLLSCRLGWRASTLLLQNISCVTFTDVETSSPPNMQSGPHVASDMCRNITATVLSPLTDWFLWMNLVCDQQWSVCHHTQSLTEVIRSVGFPSGNTCMVLWLDVCLTAGGK